MNNHTREIQLDGGFFDTLGVTISDKIADNRPDNVEVPQEEPFSIQAYWGSKPIQLGGKIIYTLSTDYDPQQGARGLNACGNYSSNIFVEILEVISNFFRNIFK